MGNHWNEGDSGLLLPPAAPRLLSMLLRLLQLLLAFLAPRLLVMLLRRLPIFKLPSVPRLHGQEPVHAKPSRCPLRLEPVAIEEAMTTDVSKRRYQMVLL